jgi:hypothetical protein
MIEQAALFESVVESEMGKFVRSNEFRTINGHVLQLEGMILPNGIRLLRITNARTGEESEIRVPESERDLLELLQRFSVRIVPNNRQDVDVLAHRFYFRIRKTLSEGEGAFQWI